MKYSVATYSVQAPKSGGGKYRRPVAVSVIFGPRASQRRHCIWERTIASNVDSRYSGKRAEYGIAMRAAQAEADSLNSFLGV